VQNKARRKIKRIDGKRENLQGYIMIGHNLEHRLVWEQTHGKSLPQGWVVHHLNGLRDDNRPGNLKALPKGKHHYALLMEEKNKRIQELEGLLKRQYLLL